ncbi:hypothetical protein A9X02_00100 [Mycobacterium malmoense]|nr:hypothetical protein A9X02_00100 [Mycobacterium malmoense]
MTAPCGPVPLTASMFTPSDVANRRAAGDTQRRRPGAAGGAPAIHDVPEKKLDELMDDLTDLVARARSFSLRSSEMADPTITVTNLGDQGVDAVFGVIYPPQVAIVGFGQPAERVCVIDGGIRVVTTVQGTLAADHRASDGHRGALFLAAINELLQQPDLLEK